jgi:hypothetical protein
MVHSQPLQIRVPPEFLLLIKLSPLYGRSFPFLFQSLYSYSPIAESRSKEAQPQQQRFGKYPFISNLL